MRDLAGWTDPAWTDQQPPQHVYHEPYADEDQEYLYRAEAHGHIMHRPELSRKPLVGENGEKGAPRVIVYPCGCTPVEGEPDDHRMEESEHDGSPDSLGTLSGPIVLSFEDNRWNHSVGLEAEHLPFSLAGRSSPFR